jgi:anhydro-N-acetylmuramic acid kinase
MDAWIQQCHSVPYDKNGTWAKSGCCNAKLLAACLEDAYFYLPYTKSTGKEYFNLDWLNRCYPNLDQLYPVDVQATLTELTAQSIIFAMQSLEISIDEVLLCGGGHYNQFLVSRLQTHLDSIPLHSTDASGIHPDWVEAIAFAWLAQQTMQGKSGNLAEATGAKGGRVLGAIHQADKT